MSAPSLANTVAEAERLRLELLEVLRRTRVSERAGVVTEMVMFYGQAFAGVQQALPDPFALNLREKKILHECVCGMAIYRVWLISDTPTDAPEDFSRMTAHWQRVTELALTGEE